MHLKNLFFAFMSVLLMSACAPANDADEIRQQLKAYVDTLDAKVGIAVIAADGDTLTVNDDGQYIMMSVFKLHQSLALCDLLSRQGRGLDTLIHVTMSEMDSHTWSPLYAKMKADGTDSIDISIEDMLGYLVRESDNNVSNILLERFVSPSETDSLIRAVYGIEDFAIAYTEKQMSEDKSRCYANWSSPYAAALLLKRFMEGDALKEPYKSCIVSQLTGCETGKAKLPAPLKDRDVVLGHKTGSGYVINGRLMASNDIGFVRKADGSQYYIAVFVTDSGYDEKHTEAIIARISEIVADWLL